MEQSVRARGAERAAAAFAVRSTGSSVLATERTLPVVAAFHEVLPEAGLVRGRTFACAGDASWSVAFALVAEAVREGAWVAAVDLPALGAEAVAELGVALDRLVRVDLRATAGWAEVVAAAVDGFELVVAHVPATVSAATLRRVQTRVASRGAVLVAVGVPVRGVDVQLSSVAQVWEQVAGDAGHLRSRRIQVEAEGRRVPRARRAELWLPSPTGGVEAIDRATDSCRSEPLSLRPHMSGLTDRGPERQRSPEEDAEGPSMWRSAG